MEFYIDLGTDTHAEQSSERWREYKTPIERERHTKQHEREVKKKR